MELYTIKSLAAINPAFDSTHIITEKHVIIVNFLKMLIEQFHSTPEAGDIIIDGSEYIHIENIDTLTGQASCCRNHYTPFVQNGHKPTFQTSGGPWFGVQTASLVLLDSKKEKDFNFMAVWSAGGAITFRAEVRQWRIDWQHELKYLKEKIKGAIYPESAILEQAIREVERNI